MFPRTTPPDKFPYGRFPAHFCWHGTFPLLSIRGVVQGGEIKAKVVYTVYSY